MPPIPAGRQSQSQSDLHHPSTENGKPPSAREMTGSQVKALKMMLEHPEGMSKSDMTRSRAVGSADFNEMVGPVHASDCGEWDVTYGRRSLVSMGLVECVMADKDGDFQPVFRLTHAGQEMARSVVSLESVPNKIPKEILDPVVIAEMAKHTYGLDNYTDDDLEAIRRQLPDTYRDIPLRPDLYILITRRRKQGAYSKKRKWVWPDWYVAYRQSDHFKSLARTCQTRWGYKCVLNSAHCGRDIEVYHRHLGSGCSSLWAEKDDHVIPLCSRCLTANRVRLPALPDECPY